MVEVRGVRRGTVTGAGLLAIVLALGGCGSEPGDSLHATGSGALDVRGTSVDLTTTQAVTTEAPPETVDPATVAAYLASLAPAPPAQATNGSPVTTASSSARGGSSPAVSSGPGDVPPPPEPSGPPFVAPTVTVDYTCIDSYPSWGYSVVATASGGSGWRLNDVGAPGGVVATWELLIHKPGDVEVFSGGGILEITRSEDYVKTFLFYGLDNGPPPKASIPVSKRMTCTFHL